MDYKQLIRDLVGKNAKKNERDEITIRFFEKFDDLINLGVKPDEAWVIVERDIRELFKKEINLKRDMLSSFWPLVAAIYFVISYVFNLWQISWVIFLVAPFIYSYINYRLNK